MNKLKIHAHENGPLVSAGSASCRNEEGREQATSGTAVVLCRCGLSWNRPFCDGSHKEGGFRSAEAVLHIDVA